MLCGKPEVAIFLPLNPVPFMWLWCICTHTLFCWASSKFWVLTEKAMNRETGSVIAGFGIAFSVNRTLVRMSHDGPLSPLHLKRLTSLAQFKIYTFFSWKGANSVATLTKRWHGAEHVFMAVLYTYLNTNTSSYFCFWELAVDQQCFCNFTGLGKWVCLAVLITAWWEHLDSLLFPG